MYRCKYKIVNIVIFKSAGKWEVHSYNHDNGGAVDCSILSVVGITESFKKYHDMKKK